MVKLFLATLFSLEMDTFLNFFQLNTALFFIIILILGFGVGCILHQLTFWIPSKLFKIWHQQSWQYLYPQSIQPSDSSVYDTKIFPPPPLSKIGILSLASTNALLSWYVAKLFGFYWTTPAMLVLMWGLLLLACIDFKHHLLPDCLTLPLLWLGLFCNTWGLFVPVTTAVWGAMMGYLSLWWVAKLFKYFRGVDGIGQGDCKLLAVFGAWWGFSPLLFIVMMGSLLGTAVGLVQIARGRHSLQKPLAFGPYLIFAAGIFLFLHQTIPDLSRFLIV